MAGSSGQKAQQIPALQRAANCVIGDARIGKSPLPFHTSSQLPWEAVLSSQVGQPALRTGAGLLSARLFAKGAMEPEV